MNYNEKLNSYIGKAGCLSEPIKEEPFYSFTVGKGVFNPYHVIAEVGYDYVVVQAKKEARSFTAIPLTLFVLIVLH